MPIEYNSQQALLDAKERIEIWIAEHSKANATFLQELVDAIEKGLGFLVYTPQNIAEVGIMFEVINNRGKELSELEKVKNYLIYCSAKLGAATLRDQINDDWSTVLRDLRAARATTSQDESAFLRYCSVVHLGLGKNDSQNIYAWMKVNWDIDQALTSKVRRNDLINEIKKFVSFLPPASMWYSALFGKNHDGIPREIIDVLEDLRSQSRHASVMPLILAVLVKNKGEGEHTKCLLQLIAVLNFRVYIAQGITARSDSGQGSLYELARSYCRDDWSSLELRTVGEGTVDPDKRLQEELCDFVRKYSDDDVFENSFRLPQGGYYDFYYWAGLRYFLMCYEAEIQPNKTIQIDRILLGRYAGKTNDYYSIEHIWARNNRSGPRQNDRPKDTWVKRRLGNFVLLEMGINITSQDFDIEEKLKIYLKTDQPTDLQQVRLLVKDASAAVKADMHARHTKNRFLDLYSSICDAQEKRFVQFAKKRWSINSFVCSDYYAQRED